MLHFIICLNRHSFKIHQRRQIEFYLPVTTAMSSFIDAILKATDGLLVNKGRNVAAEKLKEGDVTNEQLQHLIVRELDDIKSKLDGIARKDLLASIGFFKEGLVYLYKVKPNEEGGKKTQQREERVATPLKQEVGSFEASVKTVSLVEQMRSLQLTDRDNSSARAVNDAKDIFKQAREKATEAFYNEALSTSDRILAMQYRILATILEKVDRVPDALASCRFCLEELHSIPAVKKSFDIHLQQGFKSRFNKAEREDTIRSVCRMNRVIFHIAEIVEEDNDISLWPCIDRGEEKVDPLRDVRVTQTIEKEDPQHFLLKTWPFFQEGEETMKVEAWLININSRGQLMIAATDDIGGCALLKLFDRKGNLLQSLQLKLPVTESNANYRRRVIGIASDRANNVFLLTKRPNPIGFFRNTVLMFDQHANLQHEFDTCGYSIGSCIAVSDDSKVFVSAKVGEEHEKGCVLVYNFNGVLLNSIEDASLGPVIGMTSIDSEGGRIMVLASDLDSFMPRYVYQFSEEGNFLSRYKVSSNGTGEIRLRHKTEHVVELDFSNENLSLYNKDGRVVRKINLKLSALNNLDANEPEFTVTTQGLVAMLTTEKGTGKRMIAIL
ncbi:PREDICTED: uncharacterized protein LOC107348872 isoform X1 [Acropora digitifera]|uniref:uncharacterized protein LOC107348872 isoform X1 n=1 Tax=Acropora digitifera TaxID=70779 RepID=UPI00077A41AE|nr:PREDICTED: uncharacterized protein LOC107348872 isoform X1 [Acropora digitifera]